MIELKTTEAQRDKAKELAEEMGSLKHSMLRGAGNIRGLLAEIVYADKFGLQIASTYNYDLLTKNGKRVDVKSKGGWQVPQPHHWVAVERRFEQDCDFYVFARVRKDLELIWLLGWMPTIEFRRTALHFPPGTQDPDDPSFRNKLDNLQMRNRDLRQFDEKHRTNLPRA